MLFTKVLYFETYFRVENFNLCLLFSYTWKKLRGNSVVSLHIIGSVSEFLNVIPVFVCIHLAFHTFSPVSDSSVGS